MIMNVIGDCQRLYLKHWDYNSMRIMTELANIVRDHGGRVKPAKAAIISDRSITESINHCTIKIGELKQANTKYGKTPKRHEALYKFRNKLKELSAVDNSPICVFGQQYIRFTLEDKMYYYSVDSNPFFDFYYHKTNINRDGEYSQDVCPFSDPKEWLHDHYLTSLCPEDDIKYAARFVFDMLIRSRDSKILRYPNTRERKGKVDF